jgi:maltooligosyltrehalose synthase
MGFNKRSVCEKYSVKALRENSLKTYYGKSDMLIFEDELSSKIYDLYKQGKTDSEILTLINQNMEDKTNEVY